MSTRTKNSPPAKGEYPEGGRGLVPKLRFPEFRETGEWESLPIGKKVDLLSGYPFDGTDISENPRGTRLLRGINITEGTIRHNKDIDRYYLGDTDKLEKYRIKNNDLVIGMDGSKVGKNTALITPLDAGALLVQRVARLRSDGTVSIQFIFQQINSSKFHAYVDRINTSSGIPHISAKQINDFQICFPSIDEQQKIASCLSSLDELIAAQTQKLDTLKAHKKGLMQQLFPAAGETLPKLRFPEFREAGEWEEKKLGSLVEIFSGHAPSSHKLSGAHGYPYVKVEDMNNCSKYQSVSREYAEKNTSSLPVGAVLFPKRGAAIMGNKVRISTVPFYIDSNMMALFPRKDSCLSPEFLYYLILTQQLSKIADTSSIPQINNKHIVAYDVVIPLLSEQQKIADCLSSLDELITAEAQKLDTLKTHKKGLMQQLFPAIEEVQE